MTAPPMSPPLSRAQLEEIDALCSRLERFQDVRIPELLRAAVTLMELWPAVRHLVEATLPPMTRPAGSGQR